jgi:hypothetical protein
MAASLAARRPDAIPGSFPLFNFFLESVKFRPQMPDRHTIKVMLRNSTGQFLAGHQRAWSLTEDRAKAKVFDYLRDHIAEQLEALQKDSGITWAVVPVDPRERYETCDRCGQKAMSFKVFFDGREYLCPECRNREAMNQPANQNC